MRKLMTIAAVILATAIAFAQTEYCPTGAGGCPAPIVACGWVSDKNTQCANLSNTYAFKSDDDIFWPEGMQTLNAVALSIPCDLGAYVKRQRLVRQEGNLYATGFYSIVGRINANGTKQDLNTQYAESCWRPQSSPIVVSFGNNAADFTSPPSGIRFNIEGNNNPMQMAWPVPVAAGGDDAWLVSQPVVTSVDQMFGDKSPQSPECAEAPNGFCALRLRDTNGDRKLDAADGDGFATLWLWFDDGDGISETGETVLASSRMNSIGLRYQTVGRRDQYGTHSRFQAKGKDIEDKDVFLFDVYPAVNEIQFESITIIP